MHEFLTLKHLLENNFNLVRFRNFVKSLFKNNIENSNQYISLEEGCFNYVNQIHTIYTYIDSNNKKLDVLVAYLNPLFDFNVGYNAINFTYNYFISRSIDAGLIAFVNNTYDHWVLSFSKLVVNDLGSVPTILRNYYIIGKNQKIYSPFIYLKKLLELENGPTIAQIEEAFSVERLLDDFIKDYKKLHLKLTQEVQKIFDSDNLVKQEFAINNITIKDFADKLLYQIAILQYLQDRGRLAVNINQNFGDGDKNFLKQLFHNNSSLNFYNDILEPFIHEGLGKARDYDYYSNFDLRVPFLNTMLFNSKFSYNWVSTNINIPNEIFCNNNPTEYEDFIGNGILDIFERYNFTVTRSKKLDNVDKEIAINLEIFQTDFINQNDIKIVIQDEKENKCAYDEFDELHNYDYETLINQIKQKIQNTTIPLKDLDVNVNLGLGINKKLIFSNETVNEILSNCKTSIEKERTYHIIQPLFRVNDIQKYYSQWSGYFTINKPDNILNININAYPSIKKFLENLIQQENNNQDKDLIINNWFQNIKNINNNYKKEKIILKIEEYPYAYYDTTSYLIDNQLLIIYGDIEILKFIYPILNSKNLFLFLMKLYSKDNNNKLALIEEFPIPKPNYIDFKVIKYLTHLAENITEIKMKDINADVSEYEEEINEIIYKLYDLSYSEIHLIKTVYEL